MIIISKVYDNYYCPINLYTCIGEERSKYNISGYYSRTITDHPN